MEVGFTGTLAGPSIKQKETFRLRLWEIDDEDGGDPNIQGFHHGVSGESDKFAHYTARHFGFYIVGHPCDIEAFRFDCICDEMRPMKPPLDRNQDIVDEIGPLNKTSTGLLVATPRTDMEQLRSGTWSTLRRAVKAGVPIEIIQRNGEIRYEI